MATLAAVNAALVTARLSVDVTAGPDSEGEQLPWTSPSYGLRMRLPLGSPSLFFRIDDGDWQVIDGASNRMISLEIDLSVQKVFLRRAESGVMPASLRVGVDSYGQSVQSGVLAGAGAGTGGGTGKDGSDGKSFIQGEGAPSAGVGKAGDSYVDSSSGDLYLKT